MQESKLEKHRGGRVAKGSALSDPVCQGAPGPAEIGPEDCARCEIAQRFSSLVESGQGVIVCLSPDHRILEFNRAAERLYGQPRDAVLGQDYLRLFVPVSERETLAAGITRTLRGRPPSDFENLIRTPDGTDRVMLWSMSRILGPGGQPIGVIALGQDITARKQAEEALRRYEHIVRTSSDLLAFVNTSYVYQAVNAAYLEAFGKTGQQVLGHTMADVLGATVFLHQLKPDIDRCLAGERVKVESWIDLPQRGHRCLDARMNPFRDPDGTVSGVVIDSRDVTEHRQAERVLLEHRRRLRILASELALAGQRERRRVAVGLHDQVGQALAMAKLKLDAALGAELPADTRKALEESRALLGQSIQATRSLTFQLSSAVLRELGLEAALEQLVEWFDGENEGTRFVFRTDKQPKPLPEDDGAMLYDITRELLFNVVKYARAGRARVTLARVADRIEITIEDDGVGFDTACLDKGHNADGGFGYFSIRERLACLDGELSVTSSAGQGARVVLTAPLSTA